MRNIAIVEDENESAQVLERYIKKYALESGQELNVVRFGNAADFLSDYKSVYAVVFMDIQMPKLNGMDGAIELRKIDKTVSIVFVTSLMQYAQRGYEVDAVSFLVKPFNYYDFSLKNELQKGARHLCDERRTKTHGQNSRGIVLHFDG